MASAANPVQHEIDKRDIKFIKIIGNITAEQQQQVTDIYTPLSDKQGRILVYSEAANNNNNTKKLIDIIKNHTNVNVFSSEGNKLNNPDLKTNYGKAKFISDMWNEPNLSLIIYYSPTKEAFIDLTVNNIFNINKTFEILDMHLEFDPSLPQILPPPDKQRMKILFLLTNISIFSNLFSISIKLLSISISIRGSKSIQKYIKIY